MAWTVKNDNHLSAVITHFVHQGVPVIIHGGGRYPSLVNEEGVNTYDHPVIEVITYTDHVLIEASSGKRFQGWTPNAQIAKLPLGEETAEALLALAQPYLDEAAARTATVHQEWVDAYQKIWSIPEKNLSREEYEAACAEHGVKLYDDADLATSYGVKYGNFAYPHNTVETCIEMKLAFRRQVQIERDQKAIDEARRKDAQAAHDATVARLRALPVSSTETRRVPASSTPGIGQEHLDRKGRLLTVAASVFKGRISDDDPSIHGEHLNGHEGEKSFDVTYEIRQEPTECPVP